MTTALLDQPHCEINRNRQRQLALQKSRLSARKPLAGYPHTANTTVYHVYACIQMPRQAFIALKAFSRVIQPIAK
jgi:hypothetical protein